MNSILRRRLTALLASAVLALGLAAGIPSGARADGGDEYPGANSAIAINTTDGARLFELAFAVRHVAGDVVDQQNVAVAYSSCTSCQTIAIAIEIVLVDSSPSIVTPVNLAVSVNDQCTLCTSYAAAYQFVIGGNGPLEFTREGLKQLERIQKELRRLKREFEHGQISLEEVKARVEALMLQLKHVLETELVPASPTTSRPEPKVNANGTGVAEGLTTGVADNRPSRPTRKTSIALPLALVVTISSRPSGVNPTWPGDVRKNGGSEFARPSVRAESGIGCSPPSSIRNPCTVPVPPESSTYTSSS